MAYYLILIVVLNCINVMKMISELDGFRHMTAIISLSALEAMTTTFISDQIAKMKARAMTEILESDAIFSLLCDGI